MIACVVCFHMHQYAVLTVNSLYIVVLHVSTYYKQYVGGMVVVVVYTCSNCCGQYVGGMVVVYTCSNCCGRSITDML